MAIYKIMRIFIILLVSQAMISGAWAGKKKRSSKSRKRSHRSYVLSKKKFQKLSVSNRLRYIRGLRKSVVQFEGRFGKQKFAGVYNLFFSSAVADENTHCVIGGVGRERNYPGGPCPLGGRECNGEKGTFTCGAIFGGHCVPAVADGLSQACFDASGDGPTDIGTYNKFKGEIDNMLYNAKYCGGKFPKGSPCGLFKDRLVKMGVDVKGSGSSVSTVVKPPASSCLLNPQCDPNPKIVKKL